MARVQRPWRRARLPRDNARRVLRGQTLANAAKQAARIATGWRLKQVQPPLIICTHAQTEAEILAEKTIPDADLAKCRELGAALGAGIEMGVF